MKNTKLQNFLLLHLKANVLVISDSKVCALVSFNDTLTFEQYQLYLDNQSHVAAFVHMGNLINGNGHSGKYLKCLQLKFENSLSNFEDHQGFLMHKRLSIKDKFDNRIQFDDLSLEVKQKISSFISLQKKQLA